MDNRKYNGGARENSGPKLKAEDEKGMPVQFYFKNKLAKNVEDRKKLKDAVYEFVNKVYEPNLKINEK